MQGPWNQPPTHTISNHLYQQPHHQLHVTQLPHTSIPSGKEWTKHCIPLFLLVCLFRWCKINCIMLLLGSDFHLNQPCTVPVSDHAVIPSQGGREYPKDSSHLLTVFFGHLKQEGLTKWRMQVNIKLINVKKCKTLSKCVLVTCHKTHYY